MVVTSRLQTILATFSLVITCTYANAGSSAAASVGRDAGAFNQYVGVSLVLSGSSAYINRPGTTSIPVQGRPEQAAPALTTSVALTSAPAVVLPTRSAASTSSSSTRAAVTGVQSPPLFSARPSLATLSSSGQAPNPTVTNNPVASTSPVPSFYVGANSYYLFALKDADRLAVLDAMKSTGMGMLRIFVAHVYPNNKNSGNDEVPDLEPTTPGIYDDTILSKIDQLMVECAQRNIKMIIALGDRYALGFWDTDSYATSHGIAPLGSSGGQQISDASAFYLSADSKTAFDNRIAHILSHKNPLMGNKMWSQLDSTIYAFEPQNEPMGHMELVDSWWNCDRAGQIKRNLPKGSNIKISTGGGTNMASSLADWAWSCGNFDVIAVHDYDTNAYNTAQALTGAQQRAMPLGKSILFEEFGALGSQKAGTLKWMAQALNDAQIPWLVWQVVQPGADAEDFEIWTDETSWSIFKDLKLTGATNFGKRQRRAAVAASSADEVESTAPIASRAVAPGLRESSTQTARLARRVRRRRNEINPRALYAGVAALSR